MVVEGLAAGKLVALPRYVSRARGYVACQLQNLSGELAFGKFRIREPLPSCPEVPPSGLDLVLVPGVAFDLRGHRLGRGRGFYDRLLAGIRGIKCGVAFDEQIVAEVPSAEYDVRMDVILTPTQWVNMGD
jgi:5-formyltetrahydrofolate cyclo-ligase